MDDGTVSKQHRQPVPAVIESIINAPQRLILLMEIQLASEIGSLQNTALSTSPAYLPAAMYRRRRAALRQAKTRARVTSGSNYRLRFDNINLSITK